MLFPIPQICTTIDMTPMENVIFLSKGSTITDEIMQRNHPFESEPLIFTRKGAASTTFVYPDQHAVARSNIHIGADEPIVEYNVNVKLPVKDVFKVKATIKYVSKFVPKPFID